MWSENGAESTLSLQKIDFDELPMREGGKSHTSSVIMLFTRIGLVSATSFIIKIYKPRYKGTKSRNPKRAIVWLATKINCNFISAG